MNTIETNVFIFLVNEQCDLDFLGVVDEYATLSIAKVRAESTDMAELKLLKQLFGSGAVRYRLIEELIDVEIPTQSELAKAKDGVVFITLLESSGNIPY